MKFRTSAIVATLLTATLSSAAPARKGGRSDV